MTIPCWICGAPATTGKHKTKRSDLKAVFGLPTQQKPLYVTDRHKLNRPVRSLKANILKSPSLICEACNSTRTQPYDRAWEHLSKVLRASKPPLGAGMVIRVNRSGFFPMDTASQMLRVHLYFVKLFGLHIVQEKLAIDIVPFKRAILQGKAHPEIWLKVGVGAPLGGEPRTGMSNISSWSTPNAGPCIHAFWDYYVAGIGVRVIYQAAGVNWDITGAWHPRLATSRLLVADLAPDAPGPW
ncbi:hypothetical protein [Labrys neptuniae]